MTRIFPLLLLLAGCATATPPATVSMTRPYTLSQEEKDRAVAWARSHSELKDPDSAMFRNLYGRIDAAGKVYVCGEENGKNSYGGYVGYGPFYVTNTGEVWIPDRYATRGDIEYGAPPCRQ